MLGTPIEDGVIDEANQSFRLGRQTEVAHAKQGIVDS